MTPDDIRALQEKLKREREALGLPADGGSQKLKQQRESLLDAVKQLQQPPPSPVAEPSEYRGYSSHGSASVRRERELAEQAANKRQRRRIALP